ncbi:hypothetical protein BDV11DRAFT_180739 [Aspergillus similis]
MYTLALTLLYLTFEVDLNGPPRISPWMVLIDMYHSLEGQDVIQGPSIAVEERGYDGRHTGHSPITDFNLTAMNAMRLRAMEVLAHQRRECHPLLRRGDI